MGSANDLDDPSVGVTRSQGFQLIDQWTQQYNEAKQTVPLSNGADLFALSYPLGGYTEVVNDTLPGSNSLTSQSVLAASATYSAGEAAFV